jgi:hypothetical protein
VLPQLQATHRIHLVCLAFHVIQLTNTTQGLGRDRALVSGIKIEELPARMRQAGPNSVTPCANSAL